MRLGDRLTITFAVDPAAARARAPVLLLQPLIENAIRHGVERSPEAGRVEVTAAAEGGRVTISVRDDGPGLEAGVATAGGHRIGMENTRARLRQLYGDRATVELRMVRSAARKHGWSSPATQGRHDHPGTDRRR